MFLSIAQNCIETHEKVAMAVSFMIIFNRFATLFQIKRKLLATLQMFLLIAQNCIATHEELAIAVSFMITFTRFATLF